MSNQPTHKALQAIKLSKDKTYWNEIGVAWLSQDQTGLTIQLDAIPLSGRIIIKESFATQD